jgi:hypothetical protein
MIWLEGSVAEFFPAALNLAFQACGMPLKKVDAISSSFKMGLVPGNHSVKLLVAMRLESNSSTVMVDPFEAFLVQRICSSRSPSAETRAIQSDKFSHA